MRFNGVLNSKENPCYGCTTETGRSSTCHCTCKKYINAKAEHELSKEFYQHCRSIDRAFDDFSIMSDHRHERRK